MVKSRSNSPSSPGHAFGLSKADILRGRKNFDRLFEDDPTVYSENNVLIRFRTFRDDEQGCQMAFITPKRLGKANQRNAARRYLKESYRLHKKALQQALATASLGFHGAFIARTLQIDFDTIDTQIKSLIDRIIQHLHTTPRVWNTCSLVSSVYISLYFRRIYRKVAGMNLRVANTGLRR